MRAGLLAEKLGMTQVFTEKGEQVAVTILRVGNTSVVGQRTLDRDGYDAVILGSDDVKADKLKKPVRGYFAKNKIDAKRHLKEFRVSEENGIAVGSKLGPDHFQVGQWIDVSGTSVGKGFAGGMKRHGFGGLRASHGVSVSHRSHGSTGQCQDPGRVFKGKKMAGHMGARRVTTHNLSVQEIDIDLGLIYVKGCVPGAKGSMVEVKDAIKKPAIQQKQDKAES